MKRMLLLLIVLSLPSMAWAEDLYIAQNVNGSGDGSSCANSRIYTFFNLAANWAAVPTANKIDPGDTVHLCGTITNNLTAQGSGTAGLTITILFESGAKLSQPRCFICLSLANRSFIVVDGGGAMGTNGIIEATENGTINGVLLTAGGTVSGSPYSQQTVTHGIYALGSSDIEIKNLMIRNMYVHMAGTEDWLNGLNYPSITYVNAATTPFVTGTNHNLMNAIYASGSNIHIHHNVIHDAGWCIRYLASANSVNLLVHHNEIYNCDHALAPTIAGAFSLTGVSIYNNYIHDYSNWDVEPVCQGAVPASNNHPPPCDATAPTLNSAYHHNAIHAFSQSLGSVAQGGTNWEIYNNTFSGNCGTTATSHLYMEMNASSRWTRDISNGTQGTLRVFNNVFQCLNTLVYGLAQISGDAQFYNNIIQGQNINDGTCVAVFFASNVKIKNNAVTGCRLMFSVTSTTFTNAATDFNENTYGPCPGAGVGQCWNMVPGAPSVTTFAAWKAGCGCDQDSQQVADLLVNSNGSPQLGSPLINAGLNLTSLGITALNSDIVGSARSPSLPWYIGAYNTVGGDVLPPAAPTGITVQ